MWENEIPRDVDRCTTILKKLQSIIKHAEPKIAANRRLSIDRWVETYIRQVEYLKDDDLQVLYNVFCDENCWLGSRLNTATLGRMLTEEKIYERENPLAWYDMACRYCVIDKIHPLFLQQLRSCKCSSYTGEVNDEGRPATVNSECVRIGLLHILKIEDPVFTFWIDEESGKFKNHDSVEGFKKAVEFNWSEGVEYFYRCLNEEEKEIKLMIFDAITTLSAIESDHKVAAVLDFLLHEIIIDSTKHNLLIKLSNKDSAIYSALNALITWGFLDTVQDVVKHCFQEKIAVSKRKEILSHADFANLLFSLAQLILEHPEAEIQTQARMIIMDLWKCARLDEHKKSITDAFNDNFARMENALAMLIVDWKRDEGAKNDGVLNMLKFAKCNCSTESFVEFKKMIVANLRLTSRTGMQDNIDYGKFAEELFSQLEQDENNDFDNQQSILESV